MFRKVLGDAGPANCGLLLRGTKREEVERGMVITSPAPAPHRVRATVYVLSRTRVAGAFFQNYRQFYFGPRT